MAVVLSGKDENDLDQLIYSVFKSDPVQAVLLACLLENGRIYVFGSRLAEETAKYPNLRIEILKDKLSSVLSLLHPQDVFIVQTSDSKFLQKLSIKTCAQIVVAVDEIKSSTVLYDYVIKYFQLSDLFLKLNRHFKKLQQKSKHIEFKNSVRKPAVFLDRDGVVIKHVNYISKTSDVKLVPGIAHFIKIMRKRGYLIFIVTNQSGIGRQYYSWENYRAVNQQMLQLLANKSTFVDHISHSPYYAASKLAIGLVRKSLRKPRAGMLVALANEYNIDLSTSILVGDRATDVFAGMLAGVKAAYLVDSSEKVKQLNEVKSFKAMSILSYKTRVKSVKSIPNILIK